VKDDRGIPGQGTMAWVKLCEASVHMGAALALWHNALDDYKDAVKVAEPPAHTVGQDTLFEVTG
jgi:hypothetical protein